MPALPFIAAGAAIIGAGAAVVGTINSARAAGRQYDAQKKESIYNRQIQNNRAAKERRDAIRAGRLASANLAQMAENTGGSSTSAALGAMGSIQSQINSNISFLDTNQKLSNQAASAAGEAARFGYQAQLWSSVSQVGQTVFNAAGGFGAIKKAAG